MNDRERLEAGETFVVWGEQCHGLAGLRAYDLDRIFDEDGDLTPDFEQFDITAEEAEWMAKKSGSFWWKVQRILKGELALRRRHLDITARIYWDNQDPQNVGWAWATRIDGTHDSSGPLDNVPQDATDAQLIAALRSEALTTEASASLTEDAIEIVRCLAHN